ncbi:hypothetical protein A2954_03140 [Candidatus Roizmanbacteria bacterium RIFCSPLOWO2_01_FULL_37_12]|uniref:Big-1 domain-containing protein n=1 Tax=Candidatus Roizmanbacteria bacterium RIFCSPLOWO2_01_FULL_37_12 TaxID=1802056 RepID=A0A1F7IAI8_9BACT|nr:MAG: hypothetical protein A3D76_04200 [Candidatus Roizmanbacteria bacterium RIFCSPHIGHO2_02_FULL_37_9b]OGK40370.1 MAG: hypothetical protein A2954_03140 [Candidatus Roizmanbacteria bacterium RIFCSPLOWO2_01_FULL_37_12]
MDKKLLALITLFFISFAFFAGLTIFNDPLTRLIRAREDFTPSPVRSKILAWPLSSIKANGISESEINVFIVSESDKPVPNKLVTLTSTLGNLKESSATTDNNGKATLHITSSSPGIAEVQASVEPGVNLNQKITIEFE